MEARDQVQQVSARIDLLLRHPRTPNLIHAYFDRGGPFAGDTFLNLGVNEATTVSIDDLLAVSLLDVRFKPAAIRWFCEPSADRDHILAVLAEIPLDTNLWDAIDDLKAAYELWDDLKGHANRPDRRTAPLRGVGPVIRDKLMARKRPLLFPILDRIVQEALGIRRSEKFDYWRVFAKALADETRHNRVAQRLGLPDMERPPLRLLDAAFWMWGSGSDSVKSVRAKLKVKRNAWLTL
jgi:hypothetical protein